MNDIQAGEAEKKESKESLQRLQSEAQEEWGSTYKNIQRFYQN